MKKLTKLHEFVALFSTERQAPAGYSRLRDFCKQVEAGKTPDPELLQELAAAFRAVLAEPNRKRHWSVFAAAMQLHGKAGRPPALTAREKDHEFTAAVEVFLADPKITHTAAVEHVAGRYGVDSSTIERWIDDHRASAESTARWIRSIEAKRQG